MRLAAAFRASLRGTICLYQGEELGLPEADLAFEDLQDPYGITMWPQFKGRDGCRTPMPWAADEPNAGFGTAKPWLPVAAEHLQLAVDRQAGRSDSLLAYFTRLLHWRRQQPALVHGSMSLLPCDEQVLVLVREHDGQRVLCAFNFSDREASLALPADWQAAAALAGSGLTGARIEGSSIRFEPWGGIFLA